MTDLSRNISNADPVVYVLILLLASALLVIFLRNRRKNFTQLHPCPPSFPIIGHMYLLRPPTKHRTLARLAGKYGPVMHLRFGSRPVVIISSAEAADECLQKLDAAFADRPKLLSSEVLSYGSTDLVSSAYGPHWRNLRRIATVEIFSSHRVNAAAGVRSREVNALLRGLYLDVGTSKEFTKVEMRERLLGLSFNTMMMALVGKRFFGGGAVEVKQAERAKEFVDNILTYIFSIHISDFLPWLWWVAHLDGFMAKLRKLTVQRDAFFKELTEEQLRKKGLASAAAGNDVAGEKDGRARSILEVLLSLQESDPEYYTKDVVDGLIMDLLVGGTDTTASTTEWVMSVLMKWPETLRQVQEEINSVVNPDTPRLLEESDLPSLPFLRAVLLETLRLYTPGPFLIPHQSTTDCTVAGHHVPRGTMLIVNAWAIHHDKAVWEDPEEFRPKRFLADVGGAKNPAEGCRLIPFGSGKRKCPGEQLAWRFVGLALGRLVQCFDWASVGGKEIDMMEGEGTIARRRDPLVAMCKTRQVYTDILKQL